MSTQNSLKPTTKRLIEQVIDVCDEAQLSAHTSEVCDAVAAVRANLTEPLHLAVAGREKAGKSTLTNALLGRAIAPTDATTCTQVVTVYKYGHQELISFFSTTGDAVTAPLPLDGFPADDQLPFRPEELARIEVTLSSRRLRTMTLIDTPGLESLQSATSERTNLFLQFDQATTDAVARTDALIYIFPHARIDDRTRLEEFANAFPGSKLSALNVIGVLSKVDTLVPATEDPWLEARRLADRYMQRLRLVVACVLPVSGLLAETTSVGALTEEDFAGILDLARIDAHQRHLMLLSADRLYSAQIAIPQGHRVRLVELFGLHGLRLAIAAVEAGAESSRALIEAIRSATGINELHDEIHARLVQRSEPLKIAAALSALELLAYQRQSGPDKNALRRLRTHLEALSLAPELHTLDEMKALQALAGGHIALPEPYQVDFLRLVTESSVPARLGLGEEAEVDPGSAHSLALERAGWWNSFENSGRAPDAQQLARVAKVSYLLIARNHK